MSVPETWSTMQIRDFAQIGTGDKDTKDRVAGGRYPFFVRSQNIERINSWSFDGEAVLTAGDGVGTGKVFHYINGRFDYHQRVYRISNFRNGVHGKYFYYQFCRNFLARIEAMTAKSSVDSVRLETIAGMPVAVPSPDEQRRIISVLDDADGLICSIEGLLAKKRAIKQGMMQELLTGRTRLPGYVGAWNRRRLGDVLKVRNGRNQRQVEVPAGRYPILATGGEIGRTDTALYSKPSVLIGRKGTISRPQFQESPFWTVDTLFYTEIGQDTDPRFLFYLFCTIDWASMSEATGVPSLTGTRIEAVEASFPERDEQQAIAGVLRDADAGIDALERRLEAAREVKQGMMQELLTGRTRLPVEGVAA